MGCGGARSPLTGASALPLEENRRRWWTGGRRPEVVGGGGSEGRDARRSIGEEDDRLGRLEYFLVGEG
jgi:hypothetical protein